MQSPPGDAEPGAGTRQGACVAHEHMAFERRHACSEKTGPLPAAPGTPSLTCVSVPRRNQEPPQDSVIATYEEHEDSVYAVEWAAADPWLFASLSYDGRLVVNRVPRALKYRILL